MPFPPSYAFKNVLKQAVSQKSLKRLIVTLVGSCHNGVNLSSKISVSAGIRHKDLPYIFPIVYSFFSIICVKCLIFPL